MQTVATVAALREHVVAARRDGRRIGFVPTMGNLHAGHHSLIERARANSDFVVASVFVNPTQFGPNEDFDRYPRTPAADAEGLARGGCDLLYLPDVAAMYPFGVAGTMRIEVPQLGDVLEGAIRPGHFAGVATIVAKLFNHVQPDVAVFGRKDYQQWLVIRRLVADLGFPIRIIGAPTLREPDGLAMSSRNQYLDAEQRARAGTIHATLASMRDAVLGGDLPLAAIERQAFEHLTHAGFAPDYAVLRQAEDLAEPLSGRRDRLVALIAARLGSTRLIDNLAIGGAIDGEV